MNNQLTDYLLSKGDQVHEEDREPLQAYTEKTKWWQSMLDKQTDETKPKGP